MSVHILLLCRTKPAYPATTLPHTEIPRLATATGRIAAREAESAVAESMMSDGIISEKGMSIYCRVGNPRVA